MKVVLLAGGLGTRLREETEHKPKPMIEIGGQPVLWHLMKIFGSANLREFVVCTGYKGEVIKDYFINYGARTSDFTVRLGSNSSIEIHNPATEDWLVTEDNVETAAAVRDTSTKNHARLLHLSSHKVRNFVAATNILPLC